MNQMMINMQKSDKDLIVELVANVSQRNEIKILSKFPINKILVGFTEISDTKSNENTEN